MDLQELRSEIEAIDKELVKLFEKRMNVAKKVGEYKRENHLQVYNGERESELIKKNVQYLENREYEILTRRFLLQVMELSRELQEEVKSIKH